MFSDTTVCLVCMYVHMCIRTYVHSLSVWFLQGDAKRLDNFELQGLILSSEFWPAFREESLEFPSSVQE